MFDIKFYYTLTSGFSGSNIGGIISNMNTAFVNSTVDLQAGPTVFKAKIAPKN